MWYKTKRTGKGKPFEEKSVKELIPIADKVFSELVRLRGRFSGDMVRCATCGSIHDWRDIDCGHYISRRHLNTRWDVTNALPQCKSCNRFKGGEQHILRRELVARFGEDIIKMNEAIAQMPSGITADLLREKIKDFRERVKSEKGFGGK
jgi:hypothetical protein